LDAGLKQLAESFISAVRVINRHTFPAMAVLVTIFVTTHGHAVNFRANDSLESDYGVQTEIPKSFGTGEFTLDIRVRLDESFPVGPTGPQDSPAQLRHWSSADPKPYSREDWWFEGNFLLDGHNNNGFWKGTFSVQFCGGGRVRWLFGDDVIAGPGGHWAVQAYPSSATPSLLDDRWHWISLVRRWSKAGQGADLELWVDGKNIATEHSSVRTDMRKFWDGFEGFVDLEGGWFWGSEKQAAVGHLYQYEDFKGELSEVLFWSVARSAEELATSEKEVAMDAPGLVGLYRFPDMFGGRVCNALSGGECIDLRVSDRRWKAGAARLKTQDWFVLAGFACAAVVAALRARGQGLGRPAGRVWAGIALALAALALATWLNLGLLVEQSLRQLSWNEGWYALRRIPQVALLIAIGAAAYGLFRLATRGQGGIDRVSRVALSVCLALVVIAAARASSWTYADLILGWGHSQLSFGRLVEFLGAAAIVVSAALVGRARASRSGA